MHHTEVVLLNTLTTTLMVLFLVQMHIMDDTLLLENVVWTIVGNICTNLNSMSRIFAYQAHQGTFQWYHVNFSHESCH